MFIPMKASKKTFAKTGSLMENEEICPISRYLDCFASLAGDKREHPSIPYTLYPNPYILPVVCTRKFYKNKRLTGTKTRYVRKYSK
jgi:hypothetical protein